MKCPLRSAPVSWNIFRMGSATWVLRRFYGNCLNLYLSTLRESRDLDCGTSRRLIGEAFRIDSVHLRELAQIGKKYGRLDDVLKTETIGLEDIAEIIEHQRGLRCNIGLKKFSGARIERYLTGAKQEWAGANCLRVWPYSGGCFGG